MKPKSRKIKVPCSICQQDYDGMGNDAKPVNEGRCCDECNWRIITPIRLQIVIRHVQGKVTIETDEDA
jgi:hypothetical protein